jgi:hypothetical protein
MSKSDNTFDGLAEENHQISLKPLRSPALRCSLNNLNRELAGQTTDNLENIDGECSIHPLLVHHYNIMSSDNTYDGRGLCILLNTFSMNRHGTGRVDTE